MRRDPDRQRRRDFWTDVAIASLIGLLFVGLLIYGLTTGATP